METGVELRLRFSTAIVWWFGYGISLRENYSGKRLETGEGDFIRSFGI